MALVGPVRARGGVVHNSPQEETARGAGEPLGGDEVVGGRDPDPIPTL